MPTFVRKPICKTVAAFGLLASAMAAQALEYPIGTPQQRFGMEIAAVYLQPVVMEPDGMMRKAEESDIHIEADIKALAGNPNGFEGPHYGDNIKLFGPGKYHVKYTILPPSENKHAHFGRHTDRLTGVRPWFKPFDVEYDFSFVGIGKKGGY